MRSGIHPWDARTVQHMHMLTNKCDFSAWGMEKIGDSGQKVQAFSDM